MKRLLLALLVSFGLQAQAQVNYCDSISYTTLSQPVFTTIGDASGIVNMVDSILWYWQVCNSTTCFAGITQTSTYPNVVTTDTLKVCLENYIYFMGTLYTCTQCDSLIYNGSSWVLLHTGNPVGIRDVYTNTNIDNKIYDLLGRELNIIPTGKMYIRNNKLYIRRK